MRKREEKKERAGNGRFHKKDGEERQKEHRIRTIFYVCIVIFCVAGATGIGWLFSLWRFPESNIVVVYILSVVIAARFTEGYLYGICATVLATASYNYFFTAPYFSLKVYDLTYLITFAIMIITSVIISTLTAAVKRSAREREQVRQEAEQERYRGNLLRAISHDLRTPLSGIMGISEMLMGMTAKDDERYALAQGIYQDANWLHGLVENILSLTRLQEGRMALNRQMEPVEEVVAPAVAMADKRAPGREICVKIPDDVMMVPMDARLIGQVLVNLLDNAIKHTPPDGEIRVLVRENKERRMAEFCVADRGCGIAEEDLPHIFQMFYTTGTDRPDAKRGVGLGLAICESIVKAHDGMIWAKNREDGRGAEFTFCLPLSIKEQQGEE